MEDNEDPVMLVVSTGMGGEVLELMAFGIFAVILETLAVVVVCKKGASKVAGKR